MLLRRGAQKTIKKLLETWTLTITPHSKGKHFSIKIPRIAIYVLLLIFIAYSGYATLNMKKNLQKYIRAQENVNYLEAVKLENEELRTELVRLAQETETLRDDLIVLQHQGQRIQSMISDDIVEDTQFAHIAGRDMLLNYHITDLEPGGRGGSSSYLLCQDAFTLIQSMKQDLKALRSAVPAQHEEMDNLEVSVKEYNAILAATPCIWPLLDNGGGYISSNFGLRRDPFTGKQAFHNGIDIGIWTGTPVVATADGTILFSGSKAGYGNLVEIDHGYGFQTVYAHNHKLLVQRGQKVKRGEVIAYSGNTGRSTAPHLHYEVKVNGIPHDPRKYIN